MRHGIASHKIFIADSYGISKVSGIGDALNSKTALALPRPTQMAHAQLTHALRARRHITGIKQDVETKKPRRAEALRGLN